MNRRIRVHVNIAKKPEVIETAPNEYKVKVNAKPVDGAANIRLIEILAEYFNISFGAIRIVSGATSRDKVVDVLIPDSAE